MRIFPFLFQDSFDIVSVRTDYELKVKQRTWKDHDSHRIGNRIIRPSFKRKRAFRRKTLLSAQKQLFNGWDCPSETGALSPRYHEKDSLNHISMSPPKSLRIDFHRYLLPNDISPRVCSTRLILTQIESRRADVAISIKTSTLSE